MAVKGKRYYKKTRKTRRKTKVNTRRRPKCQRGGNYERDATTRTFENMPVKPLNKVVVTVPGQGIMSAAAYYRMKEDEDRNGPSSDF
jgi:hypothetical protein